MRVYNDWKKKSQNRALQLQFSAAHVLLHTTRCHFKFLDILGQRIEIQKIMKRKSM